MSLSTTYEKLWFICGVALCAFPPAGLILFIILIVFKDKIDGRYDSDDNYLYGWGIAVAGIGCFILLLTLFILWNASGKFDAKDMRIILIFAIPVISGAAAICIYFYEKRLQMEYNLCATIINYGHIRDLDQIAECLSKSVKDTEIIINKAIDRDILRHCSINKSLNCVDVDEKWANVFFYCSFCGAGVKIDKGKNLVCPYCGNPVN